MSAKREGRQMRLESERLDETERAINTPRHPRDTTWMAPRGGALQAQFVRRPSRKPGVCYEIRGDIGNLHIFRSCSAQPGAELVVGYARVAAKPISLWRLLRALEALRLPIRQQLEPVAVADGETFEVAVCGGVQASVRVTWRGGHVPNGWEPLAELAESCVREFDALPTVDEGSPHG